MNSDLINFHSGKQVQPVNTDTGMLSDREKKLLTTAHNLEWGTTKFKSEWFIGEAQFTPFGKLRQWMMELKSRENSIETIEYDLLSFEIEVKKLLKSAEEETDPLQKEIFQLEALKKEKDVNRCKLRVSDVYRERQDFIDLITAFLDTEESKTPDGRSLMEIFGTSEEEEYEKQYWTVRLAKQAAFDMSAYGRIGAGNLEAIMMCNPHQQNNIIALANQYTISFEKKQEHIRNEVAKQLGMAPKKDLYIGQFDTELLNNAIEADKESMITDLKNKSADNTVEDLNNVYNL